MIYFCPACGQKMNGLTFSNEYKCFDCNLLLVNNYLVREKPGNTDQDLISQGAKLGEKVSFYYWNGEDYLPHVLEKHLKMKGFW